MLKMLNPLLAAKSPEEMCVRLGVMLKLDEPAPIEVVRRALVDDMFAFHLMNCSGQDALLRVLFSDERNQQYAGTAEQENHAVPPRPAETEAETPSNLQLAWRAGKAMARWGAAGFAKVDTQVFKARFSACQACECLTSPPDRMVYKIKLRQDSDQRICSACGCVASRKASLPTERCPVPHPREAGLNRWGEPMGGGENAVAASELNTAEAQAQPR